MLEHDHAQAKTEAAHPESEEGPAAEGGDARNRAIWRKAVSRRSGAPEPQALNPGLAQKAEKSLGQSVGDVRVHSGPAAQQANAEMGSRAFAVGRDVVLGSGVDNSANPVLAHEVAHTVQQKGQRPGMALKAREPSSAGHELEADHAANDILAGRPARVTPTDGARLQCFEGGEHKHLGDVGFGGAPITVGKVTATPGLFTALQGDLYGGSWKDLELDCTEHPDKILKFKEIFDKEWAQQKDGKQVDDDGPLTLNSMGDRARYLHYASENFAHFSEQTKQSDATFKNLEQLDPQYANDLEAARPKYGANIAEFLRLHMDAAQRAFAFGKQGQPIDVPVAMDAGACHFLTDAFSSGHMRAPRQPVVDYYDPFWQAQGLKYVNSKVDVLPDSVDLVKAMEHLGGAMALGGELLPEGMHPNISLAGIKGSLKGSLGGVSNKVMKGWSGVLSGFVTKSMHDADNKGGLDVHNAQGSWHATGDNHMSESPDNMAMATKCVQAVSDHLRKIYAAGVGSGKSSTAGKAGPPQGGASAQGQGGSDATAIPYFPLSPILSLIPIVDNSSKNAALPEWRWDKADQSFRDAVLTKLFESSKETVAGIVEEIKKEIVAALTHALTAMLAKIGKAGQWAANKVTQLATWLVDQIPTFTADDLYRLMMSGMMI